MYRPLRPSHPDYRKALNAKKQTIDRLVNLNYRGKYNSLLVWACECPKGKAVVLVYANWSLIKLTLTKVDGIDVIPVNANFQLPSSPSLAFSKDLNSSKIIKGDAVVAEMKKMGFREPLEMGSIIGNVSGEVTMTLGLCGKITEKRHFGLIKGETKYYGLIGGHVSSAYNVDLKVQPLCHMGFVQPDRKTINSIVSEISMPDFFTKKPQTEQEKIKREELINRICSEGYADKMEI